MSKIKPSKIENEPIPKTVDLPEKDIAQQVLVSSVKMIDRTDGHPQTFGRFSVSSYSIFSNGPSPDSYRFRYTFSASAMNISKSLVSAETYILFTHNLNQWDIVKENLNNALKIYSLSLQYDFKGKSTLWAGRKINPRIANVGAIDGIQFEYNIKTFFVGIAGGSRPDFQDYRFNFNLLEYGLYAGHSNKTKNGFLQSSFALFEQRYKSNTDRRFAYFQHTNSAVKNLNLFSSFELDLYTLEQGQPKNTFNLTSLYLSINYRLSKRITLFGSYDNRKNVIYYETFRNYPEEVLHQASRQGIRFRLNYRPANRFLFSADAGTRFTKADTRPSNTLNGNATWSNVPVINSSLTFSSNLIQSAYLEGFVYGTRLNKDIMKGKISVMLNYRYVNFKYVSQNSTLKQNIGEADLSWLMSKNMFLSVNYEATLQDRSLLNRLYLNARLKF